MTEHEQEMYFILLMLVLDDEVVQPAYHTGLIHGQRFGLHGMAKYLINEFKKVLVQDGGVN